MRFGTVTLVGRTNVGKSTFLNAALGERLAIVSPEPQTTRDVLLGVAHLPDAQIAFLDTPGLHRARSELGRRMNVAAMDAARNADLALLMTDIPQATNKRAGLGTSFQVPEQDRALITALAQLGTKTLLLINKVDHTKNKDLLLPVIAAYSEIFGFEAIIPTSMLAEESVKLTLRAVAELLPEVGPGYEADFLTNQPTHFFVREYIREQVLLYARAEVPHAVAVSVDRIEESSRLLRIAATIHVEKKGQRGILVGRAGEAIRTIGTGARQRIEGLTGQKVHLELFVRVTPRWKDMPRQLAELGYTNGPKEAQELAKAASAAEDEE